MNILQIIGPVMIGPSSSHTAGAVRLGRVVNKLLDGRTPEKVEITLSGSFSETYKGHGTDRALLAGIMGYHSDAPEIRDAHPNTARIRFRAADGLKGMMQGASIGGGNIVVQRINGMNVEFNGDNHTLLVMHEDKPGVIAGVTNLMHWKYEDLNIAGFRLSRQNKGGAAIMTLEMDNLPPDQLIREIRELDHVTNAILIRRL